MQFVAYWGVDIVGHTENPAALGFVGGTTSDASLNVVGTRPGSPVLTVTGASGQTGNLQEWRNSGGTVLASVNARGIFTRNYSVAPITGRDFNTTMTVTQILDAGIIGFAATSPRTLTFPSARGPSGLVQALGSPAVGDVFTFEVFNTGSSDVTLVAGNGVTIVNNLPINSSSRVIYCRVTSISSGSETISIY